MLAFDALTPLETAFTSFGETLPLMLIGLVLFRTGFFSGEWSRARLWLLATAGTIAGLAVTVPIVLHCWRLGFPPATMTAALLYWTAPGHLLMASGYAAMLVLAAPRLSRIAPGRLLIAAGRCAFSNYLGTTLVMTALFYGWGLGLAGTVDRAGQWAFVLAGWALMLAWSAPWLRHFRRGPLEWIWRCAVEGRILQNRR